MPTSSVSSESHDHCEQCHSSYTFIKRKKTCAVCHQSYCSNCAPRERSADQSYRICVVCQSISNPGTSEDQLLALKVKHLRNYLQAKNLSHETCTEKRDLVDLIVRNRQAPFTRLTPSSNQPAANAQNSSSSSTTPAFGGLQQTMTSFADQVNSFATNIQDFFNAPDEHDRPAQTLPPSTAATTNTQATASGNTSQASNSRSTATRPRRKSVTDLPTEDNIEDLNIRELKEILASNCIEYKGCVEKNELIEKVRRLYRDRENAKLKAKELDNATAADTELCKICMDAMADCVFLDCGHMLTCVQCGKLLAECPICRAHIVRVVRVFKS